MSGRDLPGVPSLTRTDAAVRTKPAAAEASESSGILADRPRCRDREGPRCEHTEHPGLPSSAIHELRTPLTSIHGYAQVLQRHLP